MIKLTNHRLLALLCFFLTVGILAACRKDSDKKTDQVQLLSFGPTGAKHGDTLRFFGTNLDKVTEVVFAGENASVKQSDFKMQNWEEIRVIVPQSAVKGFVTLKTPQGDMVSKTQFNLNVKTSIAVTAMPQRARPGENITLTGKYLNWVRNITFSKDKSVSSFVSQSQDKLVVKVPDNAQTGPLVLTYSGTDSGVLQTTDTLRVALPTATAMAPNPVKPGSNVTITGTDLDLANKVILNGVSAPITTFVSQSATQLVVAVPATAKKGKLTMEALSGVQTVSAADLDVVLPMLTAITPTSINLGENLTITGTDLDLVKKVIFAGVAPAVTTFVSQTPTQLVVRVPAGVRTGKVTLEAASAVQTTSAGNLAVVLPSITSLSPNPVDPGTNVTITGTRLDMVNSVMFQNAAAVTSFVSQSPSQIVVRVPFGVLRGKVTIGVASPTDTVQSNEVLEVTGAAPPPTIALPFFLDALSSNWTGWNGDGWGGTKDMNNAAPVREGSKSIRITYAGGYGSPLQLGGANINLAPYTTFKFSVFGAPGSAGKNMQIKFNGQNGPAYNFQVVEGKWTDYAVPIASLGISALNEIWVQELTGNGGFTIYVDAIGLN